MKARSKTTKKVVREPEPFDPRKVNLAKVKSDLSTRDLIELLGAVGKVVVFPFQPIETLSATKTLGRGRTNLTLIAPTILQVDSATPSATFDMRNQTRRPVAQMHFEPSGYGIAAIGTYIMEFTIVTFGQCTFNLAGFAGAGTISNGGTKVVNGQAKISLVMKNVPATQHTFGFLEQTAGGAWSWFSTQVRFPPIIITQ